MPIHVQKPDGTVLSWEQRHIEIERKRMKEEYDKMWEDLIWAGSPTRIDIMDNAQIFTPILSIKQIDEESQNQSG